MFVPAALALRYWPGTRHDVMLFVCSGLAIVPLAGLMGRASENLADRMGAGVGGLLNATFGNAAELIIGLIALHKGLSGIVKASITGSIIGNILFVLGMSIVAGGMKYREQRFNRAAVQASTTSLMLAAVGLLIPTVFHYAAASQLGAESLLRSEQRLSVIIAVLLFGTYICTLVFSLVTHKQWFSGRTGKAAAGESPRETAGWTVRKALVMLLIATALVAWLSEFLVGAVEATRRAWGITETFVGVIVVAIIGNAAEHSTAIWMAVKNKLDLSVNIAVGSSLQIALFVAPVLLFMSHVFGRPMDLEFTIPEVVAVLLAVYLVSAICADGRTNWLEGIQLLSLYLILAVLFYFLPPLPVE